MMWTKRTFMVHRAAVLCLKKKKKSKYSLNLDEARRTFRDIGDNSGFQGAEGARGRSVCVEKELSPAYIFALSSSWRALSLSMSPLVAGHPTPNPSDSLGLGICGTVSLKGVLAKIMQGNKQGIGFVCEGCLEGGKGETMIYHVKMNLGAVLHVSKDGQKKA